MLCRATMGRLLQNAGNGASLTYQFLPGNHEVGSRHSCLLSSHLWIEKACNNDNFQERISCCDDVCIDHLHQLHGRLVRLD